MRRGEFQLLYDRGRRSVGSNFVLFGEPNGLGHPRLGVTATRKFGGAVDRNRIKRVIREIFRRNRPRLEPSLNIVVNVRKGAAQRPFATLEREFLDLYESLSRRLRA